MIVGLPHIGPYFSFGRLWLCASVCGISPEGRACGCRILDHILALVGFGCLESQPLPLYKNSRSSGNPPQETGMAICVLAGIVMDFELEQTERRGLHRQKLIHIRGLALITHHPCMWRAIWIAISHLTGAERDNVIDSIS